MEVRVGMYSWRQERRQFELGKEGRGRKGGTQLEVGKEGHSCRQERRYGEVGKDVVGGKGKDVEESKEVHMEIGKAVFLDRKGGSWRYKSIFRWYYKGPFFNLFLQANAYSFFYLLHELFSCFFIEFQMQGK